MNVTRRARLLNHRALRDTTILNSPFSILNLFYKNKKAPVPDFSWDRSEYALAVPPRLTQTASTLLTHQTMRAPLITGGVPVAVTWPSRSPCPAEVHSHGPCLPQSHRLRLSWRFGLPATRLRHWFVLVYLVWSQYIRKTVDCQVRFAKNNILFLL